MLISAFSRFLEEESACFQKMMQTIFPNDLHDLTRKMQITPGNDLNRLPNHLHHFGIRRKNKAIFEFFEPKKQKYELEEKLDFRQKERIYKEIITNSSKIHLHSQIIRYIAITKLKMSAIFPDSPE